MRRHKFPALLVVVVITALSVGLILQLAPSRTGAFTLKAQPAPASVTPPVRPVSQKASIKQPQPTKRPAVTQLTFEANQVTTRPATQVN